MRLGAVWVVVGLAACGGGSGNDIVPRGAAGKVILPAGFADALTDLTVHSGIDRQPVGSDGKFHIQVLGPGPALVTATDPTGKVVLLGYVDAASTGSAFAGGKGEISAQQTALALLFYATGVFTVPASLWSPLRDLIAQSAEVGQLADMVSARVLADPIALTDGDAQLLSAAQAAAASLLAATRSAPWHPPHPLAGANTLLLVDPSGEQSGVEVLNSDGISFGNHIRRRSAAFIYETATQQPDGDLTKIPAKPLPFSQTTLLSSLGTALGLNPLGSMSPVIEVQPANPLHGIVGSISDALSGNTAFTVAPTPANGSIDLPQDGQAIKTVYSIMVLGPAFQTLNSLAMFPPAQDAAFATFVEQWQDTLTTLSWEEWLLDIVLPVIGSLPLPEAANLKQVQASTIQELINVVGGFPDLNASVANGDFKGALTSLIQNLVDNGTAREDFIKAIYSQFTPEVTLQGQLDTASEDLAGVFSTVSIIELIFQAVDSSAVLRDSSTNNAGEEWKATIVQKTARLNPPTATIDQNHTTVPLTATPGTPGDPDVPFMYSWSVSGTAGGGVTDPANSFSGVSMQLLTGDSQVTYFFNPAATSGQSDTVTVEVFLNAGTPSAPMKGALLGQASSTLTVQFLPCDQALPMGVVSVCGDAVASPTTIKPGDQLSVAVTLHTGGACGNGASLDLNGTPFTSATVDGAPVSGMVVPIAGTAMGTGTVMHDVVFTVSGNALLQCPLAALTEPNQVIPTLTGPWVVLNEGTGGNFSGWTSAHPFVIDQ